MVIGISPRISFKSAFKISDENVDKIRKQMQDSNVSEQLLDTFNSSLEKLPELDSSDKKDAPAKKKKTLKERIASVAKFFTATEEITKGTAKGAVYGTMTGIGMMALNWLFVSLPKGFTKKGSLKETFKHPIKSISKGGKIASAVVGAGVLAYHIVRGKLQANQRNAFVDQKLNNYQKKDD